MRRREPGLFAEPAGEVTRVAETERPGNRGDAGAALETVLRGSQQFTVAPLPEGQAAGTSHEPVKVILLQTGAVGQFGRTRPTTVFIRSPGALQAGEDGGAGMPRGRFSGTRPAAGVEDEERDPTGGEIKVASALRREGGHLLPHGGESFGGKLSVAETVFLQCRSGQIGHEADGAARRLFAELMEASGRDEENGTGSDGMALLPDALLAVAT